MSSLISVPYLYVPMKASMHLDNTQIGLMGSVFGLASMIFYWPGGWLADRVSPRALITLSLVATGLLGFWMAALPSFSALLVIQFLMGMLISLTLRKCNQRAAM